MYAQIALSQHAAAQTPWSQVPPIVEQLKTRARALGLWNLFLPSQSGLTQVCAVLCCAVLCCADLIG